MIIEIEKDEDGEEIEIYTPENEEDQKKLNEMVKNGEIDPGKFDGAE